MMGYHDASGAEQNIVPKVVSTPPRELEKMQDEINSRCFERLRAEHQEAIDDCQALQQALNYAEARRNTLSQAMNYLDQPQDVAPPIPGRG